MNCPAGVPEIHPVTKSQRVKRQKLFLPLVTVSKTKTITDFCRLEL